MKPWFTYHITLRDDYEGEVTFAIPDTRLTNAVRRLLKLELAPFRSVLRIRRTPLA